MNYDPELAALLSQPWSNNACRGYVIYAMENCGFSPQDIRRVVAELYEVFDIRGLETIFYKGIMPSEKVLDFPVDCNTLTGSVNL